MSKFHTMRNQARRHDDLGADWRTEYPVMIILALAGFSGTMTIIFAASFINDLLKVG